MTATVPRPALPGRPSARGGAVRILVVDDDPIFRRILASVIEAIPHAAFAGAARNGEEALDKLRGGNVDLVLLDVEMPVMDGPTALSHIQRDHPDVSVVMVGGLSRAAASLAVQAVGFGAMDFVPKPNGDSSRHNKAALIQTLSTYANAVATRIAAKSAREARLPACAPPARPAPERVQRSSRRIPGHFSVVAIGSSTGGPAALIQLVPKLRRDLACPVVIVQHMPPNFTSLLAERLDTSSALAVREAEDDEAALPGTVLMAPGGRHLELVAHGGSIRTRIHDAPPANGVRPSIDVLFRSLARSEISPVLAVILTGMGRDGVEGVVGLRSLPCWTIAQDERSSVVYGMPRALLEAGEADQVLPLNEIAGRVNALVSRR